MSHNCKAIQFNMIGFYFGSDVSACRGAFLREYLIQDFFSKVYNCVTSMFTFVAMVTIDTW